MEDKRIKYRLKFKKGGRLRFIGHLDLLNLFHRAVNRAKLPASYSMGFNPHQETSFALPLSLGHYGNGEYVDIMLREELSGAVIADSLNAAMPNGVEILAVRKLSPGEKGAASIVAAASYRAEFTKGLDVTPEDAEKFFSQNEIIAEKKTKKGSSLADIKPEIISFTPEYNGNGLMGVSMTLCAGPYRSVRADLVIEAFMEFLNLEYDPYGAVFTREALFKEENGELIPL